MRSWWVVVLGLSIAQGAASPALAAPAGRGAEDAQSAARSQGEQGLRLFEAGKWASAYDAFQRADELFHAPTLVLYMAHCRRNQGKLLDARALYEKVAAEPVPRGAPEQFSKAVASAQEELTRIRKRIASVRVEFTSPPPPSTTVKIDGAVVDPSALSSGKELDPGEHEIVAAAGADATAHQTISLKDGEAAQVTLTLGGPSERRGSGAPGGILVGLGAVGVGVGAVTGVLALSKISDIKSRCRPDGHCLKADQPEADAARTLTTASTIGFIAGGVALATGVVLLAVRPGGAKAQEKAALRVEVGPGSLLLKGRF